MPEDFRDRLSSALHARYAVDRLIDTGGMATGYLARDLGHERLVALKVLEPELGAMLGSERSLAEIRTTASLQHPNLLPLFDSGEADGLLVYVVPYVAGESLSAAIGFFANGLGNPLTVSPPTVLLRERPRRSRSSKTTHDSTSCPVGSSSSFPAIHSRRRSSRSSPVGVDR